jgi:hypothetical protein
MAATAERGSGQRGRVECVRSLLLITPLLPLLVAPAARSPVLAGTFAVGARGEGPALAQVLLAAEPGDTVLVAPGRYVGRFRIPDRLVVIATAGPDSTVLDGGGAGPVVIFEQVTERTLLEGFTITGGVLEGEEEDGAGILCTRHASPRLNYNRIVGNHALGADGRGGGIACVDGSHPVIANSRIEDNEAATGGGIYIGKRRGWSSSPIISGNLIFRNRARGRGGGIAITHLSEPVVSRNLVAWNGSGEGGGGLSIERGQPRIEENVVWENVDSSATASGLLLTDWASPTVERNIVGRNSGGPGVSCEAQFQEWQEFRCNDVWGHADGDFAPGCSIYPGNLSADPLFCDPAGEHFGLSAGSPCLDAPNCGRLGPSGSGCVAGPGRRRGQRRDGRNSGGLRSRSRRERISAPVHRSAPTAACSARPHHSPIVLFLPGAVDPAVEGHPMGELVLGVDELLRCVAAHPLRVAGAPLDDHRAP